MSYIRMSMMTENFSTLPATFRTEINIQKLDIQRWSDFFDWDGL